MNDENIRHQNSDDLGKSTVRGSDDPLVKVQPPRREDLQPSYASVIKPDTEDDSQHGWYGGMINALGAVLGNLGAIPCCIICPNPYKPVSQGNVGLVTKFGRFSRAVDPGLVKINPLSEQLIQIDVKIQIVGKSTLLFLRRRIATRLSKGTISSRLGAHPGRVEHISHLHGYYPVSRNYCAVP
jgi:erythrocyte band 7 integral membrane protein